MSTTLEHSLSSELLRILREHFHFSTFRPGQLDILQSVLNRQDAMAVMPTGGGKSLCFQLPALYQKGIVVVISPLISLMKDQVRSLKALGIAAGCLYSGQTRVEKQEVFRELKEAEYFILYLSPERVQKAGFAEWVKNKNISLFAIDEAHCVSQWGPDFRQDYHRLALLREMRPDVPILALTATATPPVLSDIRRQLGLKDPSRHIYGFYRPNLYYQVETCENKAVKMGFLQQALRQTLEGRVLIYCGTRKQCEELAAELNLEFSGIDFYHAGLTTEQRNRIQQDFELGKIRILAATNAFGMGIDHPDVRLVVHYQMPANIESLYQEMGRAGRDGNDSTCLLLYAKKDKGLHGFFISQSEAAPDVLRRRWNALETLTQFAEGAECRHGGILTYFRDTTRIQECGHCDTCAPQSLRRIPRPVPTLLAIPIPKKKKAEVPAETGLSSEALQRVEMLRKWRREFAQAHDVPAFMIFSNKTLHDLAHRNPGTLSELEKVYGLGPHKIEKFGSLVLEELKGV